MINNESLKAYQERAKLLIREKMSYSSILALKDPKLLSSLSSGQVYLIAYN